MTPLISTQQQRLAIRLLAIFLVAVILFALIYFGLTWSTGNEIKPPQGKATLLDCAYFSVVTITTLGYGDISPQGFSRLVACFEVIFGLIFVGYAISQIVSANQEALIQYLANARIIETYNECLEMIKDAKELIADKRRLIQAKVPVDPLDYIYNRSNPFYPALRAVEMLNGYTGHIEEIGEAQNMSDRIERAAHHIEELAGFTRKLLNLLVSQKAAWRTPRTALILTTLCDSLDAFGDRFLVYTRYSSEAYKAGGLYKDVLRSHTAHIRLML